MEKISIFNYEAYYLDYLEGNLNEEDTALLLAFLEANPDLKLDDEDLDLTLEAEASLFDSQGKRELFQHGQEDAVSMENIEFFMISAREGILDASKKEEVFAFLDTHPLVQQDWKIYNQTTLEADLTIGYADKEELKQKTRVLWPYISLAAAASVAALITFWPGGRVDNTEASLGYLAGEIRVRASTGFGADHSVVQKVSVQSDIVNVQNGVQKNIISYAHNPTNGQNTGRQNNVNQLNHRPAGNVLAIFNNLELQPIAKTTFHQENPETNPNTQHTAFNDMASAQFAEMSNPIEPITKFVADRTNTDIDFRKTEKGAEGKKGFYIKIGKFELSRKKH